MSLYVLAYVLFAIYAARTEIFYHRYFKREVTFLHQFDDFLSRVRHFYYYTGSAEDAIYYSIEKTDSGLRSMVEELLSKLESEHSREEVSSYISDKHKYMKLFASLVLLVSENGDSEDEKGSVFLDSVMQLRSDIQDEIRYLERRKHRFTGLCVTAALPAASVPVIAAWGSNTISTLNVFYKGRGGSLMLAAILSITFGCYRALVYLRRGKRNTEVKWAEETERVSFRLVVAGTASIIMLLVLAAGHESAKALLKTDISEISDMVGSADSRQLKALEAAIPVYTVKYIERELEAEKEELTELLLSAENVLSQKTAEECADYILSRVKKYRKEKIDAKDVLIILIVFVLTYFMTDFVRAFVKLLSDEGKQEEIMQFQNLIHMQKRVPGITPIEILESMEDFAYYFKKPLRQCINEYCIDERAALTNMATEQSYTGFVQLIDCFLAVDDAGIEKAFDEVSAEIDIFKENRELSRMIILDNNVMLASLLSVIPGGVVLFGYLLIPFMTKALSMFNTYQDTLKEYIHAS